MTGYPSIESSLAGLLGLTGPISAESSAADVVMGQYHLERAQLGEV